MSTNNNLNVPLSGNSGTVNFVGSTSPTFVTPILGVATATSLAFSPTTGGIVGTTAADSASSGYSGEAISSQIASGSAISITSATPKNLTSISLTAGDWDVFGNITFIAAASTVPSNIQGGISTTSATLPNNSLISQVQITFATGSTQAIQVPYQRINVNSPTTVYMVAQATFITSTMTMCGYIFARRMR